MKIKTLAFTLGVAAALCAPWQQSSAADDTNTNTKPTAMEKAFVKKAAQGGMTEVALGKIAAEKGGSEDVKDFGNLMVKDHTNINDNLKEVAGKMDVKIPADLNAKHQAMVDKFSKLSGAEFDNKYVPAMVKDHKNDINEFEEADKTVKNPELKKFIEDSLPTLKSHLEKIEKFSQAKG